MNTETTPKLSWKELPADTIRPDLHIQLIGQLIVVNPEGDYDLELPPVYAGRAFSAMRQVQEGGVIDLDGVVKSQRDTTKCYIYDEELKMMIEGHIVLEGHRMQYRKSIRRDLSFIPSKGYYYEGINSQTGEIFEVRLTYDSHHLAWLIAQGVRILLPNTPRTLETLEKQQQYAAAEDRTSFTHAFWAHRHTDAN